VEGGTEAGNGLDGVEGRPSLTPTDSKRSANKLAVTNGLVLSLPQITNAAGKIFRRFVEIFGSVVNFYNHTGAMPKYQGGWKNHRGLSNAASFGFLRPDPAFRGRGRRLASRERTMALR
jgi:hypothetical protein